MSHELFEPLKRLTDLELLAQASRLAGRGREVTARLIAHLVELDSRRLPLQGGYPSLHAYCVEALFMSDAEAYLRIEAARVARRFPVVLDMILDGSTNVSCLKVLSPHLEPETYASLLEEARGKRKTEVERIVARLSPKPDVPTTVRKLPEPAAAPPSPAPALVAPAAPPTLCSPPPPAPPPPATRATLAPLSPARYSYQLTIDEDTRAMLELARDLASHAVSPGDDLALLKKMLETFLEDQVRKRFGATDNPQPPRQRGGPSRHVPVAVKREVFLRDRGRCAYVAPDGRRCGSRAFLQFHHLDPYRAGGEARVGNTSLRCGPHNRLEEQLRFEGSAPSQL
jgi:hypothetical protein